MLIIDFSKPFKIYENQATNEFEQSVLDFIEYYLCHDKILVQTSGSTGEPKDLVLSKKNIQLSAKITGNFLSLKKNNSALLCLPMSYIAGKMMVVRAIELKLKLYCIPPKIKLQIPDNYDFAAMTPAQCEASYSELGKIKKLIIGGAAVKFDLRKKLEKISTDCYETYGMTETITHIAMRKIGQDRSFKVLPQMEIKTGEKGNLHIKTPYSDNWLETNDLVEITNDGFDFFGRLDDVINSGGVKINPEKVENILKPYIRGEFVISSISDEDWGEKIVLVVEQNQEVNLIKFSELNLSKFEVPKEVIFLEKFPRTHSGKIQRKKIKEFLKP